MIKLPTYTFLNAPKESGKTTLIVLLRAQDPDLGAYALADPLYDALLATYFPDELYAVESNVRSPERKKSPLPLPDAFGKEISQREWLIEYGIFIRKMHGPIALSKLVHRAFMADHRWYFRAVIDGARIPDDLAAFPLDECLIIHIERKGTEWSGDLPGTCDLQDVACQHVTIQNNGAPAAMLDQLAAALGTREEE